MFGFLTRLFGSNDSKDSNVIGGADEVFNAILEHGDTDTRYIVEFREPELVDRGGQYSNDYMVRVPTFTDFGEPDAPNIEYPLPEGEEEDSDLYTLLDLYGIDTVADLGQLEGETVLGTFENGTLTLRFDLEDE